MMDKSKEIDFAKSCLYMHLFGSDYFHWSDLEGMTSEEIDDIFQSVRDRSISFIDEKLEELRNLHDLSKMKSV